MLLTVRSDFPIMAAIWFCVAVGFVCTTRSTAISSKVQDLHFRGWLSAKFALWTAPFALWTSSLVSSSFQSMCNSRFRKLSRVRGQVLEPSIYNWEMARTARKHSDSGVYHVILRGVKRIIGDRFIDPKEWTNVPVPMTLVPMTLQHPTSVKNRLHFHTFFPKSLHNPNKCLTFAATVPATPLPWMRTTAGLRVFIEYM